MGGGMPPGGGMGGMLGSKGGRTNGGRGGGPLIIPKGGGGGLRSGGGPRNTGLWAGTGEGPRNRTACCTILLSLNPIVSLSVCSAITGKCNLSLPGNAPQGFLLLLLAELGCQS